MVCAGAMICKSYFHLWKQALNDWKSGGADEVDLFGLWAFESILVTVCRRWERWKSNLLLASTRDASDLRAEASRKMKPLVIKWCPLLVTNQTHTGGRGETTCNFNYIQVRSRDPVEAKLLPAHTGNPFLTTGSFTLWMLEKQPFGTIMKRKTPKKKDTVAIALYFFFVQIKS